MEVPPPPASVPIRVASGPATSYTVDEFRASPFNGSTGSFGGCTWGRLSSLPHVQTPNAPGPPWQGPGDDISTYKTGDPLDPLDPTDVASACRGVSAIPQGRARLQAGTPAPRVNSKQPWRKQMRAAT